MAARVKKLLHDEETRARIQISQIINRLEGHVFGKIELSPTQVKSAEILLRKRLPDLTAADNKTEVTHVYVAELPPVALSPDEWQAQNKLQ